MNTVSVLPAYGRDYKSKKDLLIDFKSGKDFMLSGLFLSGYFSITDLISLKEKHNITHLQFRYKKQYSVFIVSIDELLKGE